MKTDLYDTGIINKLQHDMKYSHFLPGTSLAQHPRRCTFYRERRLHLVRLTIAFLLLTLVAVYGIDRVTGPRQGLNSQNNRAVYIRQEGRNCPLYYPDDRLR